jgi:hypothetical protein
LEPFTSARWSRTSRRKQPWTPLAEATLHQGLAKHKGWKKDGYLSAKGKRYLTGKRILWEHGDLEGSVHSQAGKIEGTRIMNSNRVPHLLPKLKKSRRNE